MNGKGFTSLLECIRVIRMVSGLIADSTSDGFTLSEKKGINGNEILQFSNYLPVESTGRYVTENPFVSRYLQTSVTAGCSILLVIMCFPSALRAFATPFCE